MRLGVVILPELRRPELEARWRRAEELGFDHAWTYDHLAWRSLRDEPWFDAVPTLAAAAMVTTRIRLGTMVASPTFRHPVPFARELLALDDLSDGRFTLGIGAGAVTGWDTEVLGGEPWSARERADRFAEFVALLDRLQVEREVDHRGAHYVAVGARSYPGCVQQPRLPFAVAAPGPRGMRVAVRHGQAWVTNGVRDGETGLDADAGVRSLAPQLAAVDAACEAEGRDPATLDRVVVLGTILDPGLGSPEQFRHVVGTYAAAGFTDLVVHWPRLSGPFAGDEAAFEASISA